MQQRDAAPNHGVTSDKRQKNTSFVGYRKKRFFAVAKEVYKKDEPVMVRPLYFL